MISKTKKNHLIPLDYEEKRFATNNELLIDKETNNLYAVDKNGELISFYDEYLSKLERDEVIIRHTIYGVDIDMSNPDTEGAVTYTNHCKRFVPLSMNLTTGKCDYGNWKDIITNFLGIRPCIFSDKVEAYLNPEDYSKTINGGSAYSYSGNVMIEFKKRYYKFSIENNILSFRVSDINVDGTYSEDAFLINSNGASTVNDYMYISTYPTSRDDNGNISSKPGFYPYIANRLLSDLLLEIESDNSRYTILGYNKYLYILGLFWLVTRSLDTSILGKGTGKYVTGALYNKGLFYGTEDGPSKIFGLENFWTGYPLLCAGITGLNGSIYLSKNGPYYHNSSLYNNKEYAYIEMDLAAGEVMAGYPSIYEKSINSNIIFPKRLSLDIRSIDHFSGVCIYVNDAIERYLIINNSGSSFQFFSGEENLVECCTRLTYC